MTKERQKNSKHNRPHRTLRSTMVEPFKQVKIGLYVVAITMAFVTVAGFMFVAAFTEQYTHVMNIFQVVDPNLRWELVTNDVFYTNAIRLGVFFFAYVVAMMWVVFKMTHRIYGPLVSIERFIGQVTEGQYHRRVTIRSGDELQRLAIKLNEMAEALQKKHGTTMHVAHTSQSDNDDDESGIAV